MTTAPTNPVLKSNLMISIGLPNPNPTNSSFSRHSRLMMNYSNFENYLRSRHCYSGRLRLLVAEVASSSPPEPFGRGGQREFAAATHLQNPNRRNCPRLVTNYSNFENYFTIRHNYIRRNRRLLQFPAASYFSSSSEPSPRPLDTLDILFKIGFVTMVLGSLGWKLATGVRPCSSFISSSTSHLSNCCRCYNHCSCVPDEQEQKKFDAIAGEEIAAKTFWTVVVVYAVPLVAFIVRTAITKYRSGSAHLLQVSYNSLSFFNFSIFDYS